MLLEDEIFHFQFTEFDDQAVSQSNHPEAKVAVRLELVSSLY